MTNNSNDPMITFSNLLYRGWNPSLVDTFLKEPDLTKPAARYRLAGAMRFYRLARIEAIEATEAFLDARAADIKRSETGRKRANRVLLDLVGEMEKLKIQVRVLPLEEVQKRALRAYNKPDWSGWLYMQNGEKVSDTTQERFLQRIMVNFVRRSMTKYDDMLESLATKVGTDAARIAARRKLYDTIAAAYPALDDECDRQFESWMEDAAAVAEREYKSGRPIRKDRLWHQ